MRNFWSLLVVHAVMVGCGSEYRDGPDRTGQREAASQSNGGCVAIDQCHLAGVRDPISGTCSDPIAPDSTPCDDAISCTSGDSCQAGACVATSYQRCDAIWRTVPVQSIPTRGTCTGACVQELNADDGAYLEWLACTNGNNSVTEYDTPTDLRFWVSDYTAISDATITFDAFASSGGAGPFTISCVDPSGARLATLVSGAVFGVAPSVHTWDVPVACFSGPLVTLRVERLGGSCLAVDHVQLAVASDYRREQIQSIPSAGTCTGACLDSLNSDDGNYLQWIACSNGFNTATEYDTPTDLRFTIPDYASVTSATANLDIYASGSDARVRISCVDDAGVALATIYDGTSSPIPQTAQLYSWPVPTACFVSPTITLRIERLGANCLGADAISLDVKSSARRVPLASVAARGTCAALGTQCVDQLNRDDGGYLNWIACSDGLNTATEYDTPTDLRFTVLDHAQVTRAAIALDVFGSGEDARMQITCVDPAGATLATILPTSLFSQTRQVVGYTVPLACFAGETVTIRVQREGANCLGADYVRLYTTSSLPPFLIPDAGPVAGYTDRPSVAQGEAIAFKIHTTSPTFSIDFVRLGRSQTTVSSVTGLVGRPQATRLDAYRRGAGWTPSYVLTVPTSWRSGMYAAHVMDGSSETWITFIVRDSAPGGASKLAVIASTNTWDAYNDWGGASFYSYGLNDISGRAAAAVSNMVSMERPRVTGTPIGDVSHTASGELHILRWLDDNQYSYSMLTDWDLHRDPSLLAHYSAVIISTHSEYWSAQMYDQLESYLDAGGHLLYLSGNGLYWKVTLSGGEIEVHKDASTHAHTDETGGLWRDLSRPEARLLGIRYTGTGYPYSGSFEIRTAAHWSLEGTGLAVGDRIGKHGLNLLRFVDGSGVLQDISGGGAAGWEMDTIDPDNRPANLVQLAHAVVHDDVLGMDFDGADMTYYERDGGGAVFAAGSINFGGSLVVDDHLGTIVANVLGRFGISPSTGALRQIVPIDAIPTGGTCTESSCIPGMTHSDNSYLQWIACSNGLNTSTEYDNPTEVRFSVPDYSSISGATLTLDGYGSGQDAVESITCVDDAGVTLATLQPASSFPPFDPLAINQPSFAQIHRWEVPSICFVGPTLGIRVSRSGANCLGIDYLGLALRARETPVAISSIPTAGSCTAACVARLNADDGDYLQWLACADGVNTATEYTSPTDLQFSVPGFASVTGGVFVLDAFGSGGDARVAISCIDASGRDLATIQPTTRFSQTPQLHRFGVPPACFAGPMVTVRLTRVGANCLGVDYARLLTAP